jgi:hypothetical protein
MGHGASPARSREAHRRATRAKQRRCRSQRAGEGRSCERPTSNVQRPTLNPGSRWTLALERSASDVERSKFGSRRASTLLDACCPGAMHLAFRTAGPRTRALMTSPAPRRLQAIRPTAMFRGATLLSRSRTGESAQVNCGSSEPQLTWADGCLPFTDCQLAIGNRQFSIGSSAGWVPGTLKGGHRAPAGAFGAALTVHGLTCRLPSSAAPTDAQLFGSSNRISALRDL